MDLIALQSVSSKKSSVVAAGDLHSCSGVLWEIITPIKTLLWCIGNNYPTKLWSDVLFACGASRCRYIGIFGACGLIWCNCYSRHVMWHGSW